MLGKINRRYFLKSCLGTLASLSISPLVLNCTTGFESHEDIENIHWDTHDFMEKIDTSLFGW